MTNHSRGAEQLVGDHQRADRVVAGPAAGVADHVGVALGQAGVLRRVEPGVHAGEDREAARRRQRQLVLVAEVGCVGLVGLQDLVVHRAHGTLLDGGCPTKTIELVENPALRPRREAYVDGPVGSEVHAAAAPGSSPGCGGPGWPGWGMPSGIARRQRPAHLLQLGARGHLLGVDRGLDAVEQPLEPADQLRLGDPQLGLGRGVSELKGSDSRSSSSTSSGASPASSSLMEDARSRRGGRLASSSGADFTSSRSWRIIPPMRITLAGCSTSGDVALGSSASSRRLPGAPGRAPSRGAETITCGSPAGLFVAVVALGHAPSHPCREGRARRPRAYGGQDDLADVVAGLHDPVALAGLLQGQRDVHQRPHRGRPRPAATRARRRRRRWRPSPRRAGRAARWRSRRRACAAARRGRLGLGRAGSRPRPRRVHRRDLGVPLPAALHDRSTPLICDPCPSFHPH